MDIKKLLKNRKRLIDKELNKILPKENIAPKRLHKAMRYCVFSGGKRIRPILAIESCLCCEGNLKDALISACAIEMVHAFSLVHDDLPAMDNDDYRRGKLTCHKKFDEATAVLAGDSLLCLAFEILSKGKDAKVQMSLTKELSSAIGSNGMAGGQSVDIEYENRKKSAQILNYINMRKTAFLIKASLKIGALAAGASATKVRQMSLFGECIGETFQIVDDILDNGESVRVLGKVGVQKRAESLTAKANTALKGFKEKADTLRFISEYLVRRDI